MEQRKFDLEERTKNFAKVVLDFVKLLPKTTENLVLIRQLVRSATSVGANYLEATDADSRRDFVYKIRICRRESKESVYWVGLIAYANPGFMDRAEAIIVEGKELTLIFSKSIGTALAGSRS